MKTTPPDKWKVSTQVGRDMHSGYFTELICEHGIGHHKGVHGCDGCCANVPKAIWNKVTSDRDQEECVRCAYTRYAIKNYAVVCKDKSGKIYKRHRFS